MTERERLCGEQFRPDTPLIVCDKPAGHRGWHSSPGIRWGNPRARSRVGVEREDEQR